MTIHHFVWNDLSTFDTNLAKDDYRALFGWSYQADDGYEFAMIDTTPVAALFPMPKRLADLNMPSFWMSYIRVENLDTAVATARNHDNVVIEIAPQAFSEDARIALVRDPSGAGFTMYEGPDIKPPLLRHGSVIERYHHLPNVELIAPFYTDLFGWRFQQSADSPWPVHDILDDAGTRIALAESVPETNRGKFRYWMPCFAVEQREAWLQRLAERQGSCTTDLTDGRHIVADRQGAHFMIRQAHTA